VLVAKKVETTSDSTNVRFWHKADIPAHEDLCLLSGVKRTWNLSLRMSAFDPKRTWRLSIITLPMAALQSAQVSFSSARCINTITRPEAVPYIQRARYPEGEISRRRDSRKEAALWAASQGSGVTIGLVAGRSIF